jgi:hypothetical protein
MSGEDRAGFGVFGAVGFFWRRIHMKIRNSRSQTNNTSIGSFEPSFRKIQDMTIRLLFLRTYFVLSLWHSFASSSRPAYSVVGNLLSATPPEYRSAFQAVHMSFVFCFTKRLPFSVLVKDSVS